MATPPSSPFSWRGLLQSLVQAGDDALGAVASPLAAAQTPRWSRHSNSTNSEAELPAGAEPSADAASLRYSASRLEGEFNVWFTRKPLGLGLVPSTQLYGAWEISTVAPMPRLLTPGASSSAAPAPPSYHDDAAYERRQIRRGDVIVAVNFAVAPAQLPRDELAAYLHQSACPVVVTLRRPALYGSIDSRALSTAMFPASIEYRGKDADHDHKTFLARASSKQWSRSLQHELNDRSLSTKHMKKKNKNKAEPAPEMDPAPLSSSSASSSDVLPRTVGRGRIISTAELTPMGEYTSTFHDVPLRLVLAPSTRLYGSVEVYDPKKLSPLVQIGDVVMAINGDSSVAKWPTDDAIDHITGLEPPITIKFRRPAAYRKYLETYFKASHAKMSSRSTATAMFPDSAEYKHGHHYRNSKKHAAAKTRRGLLRRDKEPQSLHDGLEQGQGALTKQQWTRISHELSSSDQFKLWQSGSSRRNFNNEAAASTASAAAAWSTASAFLTERHVHYLWAHLPEYLTCNDMELVFDTRYHGWNLLSFYAHVQDKGPTIVVVKDTRDQIFGAFSSTSWKQSGGAYGNGRCFVFSLRPQMKVYAWSGLDDTFMHGRRDSIMMGGGKKGMALCLQPDELRGFSNACDTFDSPSLTPSTNDSGDFDMENMEVWCFSGLRV